MTSSLIIPSSCHGQERSHSAFECIPHQQNVFYSVETSRRVWEDVECTHSSDNFRRELDPRRAFQLAFGVTRICDNRVWHSFEVIVISLGPRQSARENLGCPWVYCWTNQEIRNRIWEMSGFLWIVIRRTAGVIWHSQDLPQQVFPLESKYDASIITSESQ